jgi:hypothetical protein
MTQEELYKLIDRDRVEYIDRQRHFFDEMKPMLLENYLNEYVALEDGQVLDHDVDDQQLADRVYAKYGYRDLLMKQVTVEETVYHVGGFRMMEKPAELGVGARLRMDFSVDRESSLGRCGSRHSLCPQSVDRLVPTPYPKPPRAPPLAV